MNCEGYIDDALQAAQEKVVKDLKNDPILKNQKRFKEEGFDVDECMSSHWEYTKALKGLAETYVERSLKNYV